MKNTGVVRIAVMIVFLVIIFLLLMNQSTHHSEVVLDSFEGPLSAKTVDFGSADGSSLSVIADTSAKMCGNQSLRIAYRLEEGGYMWCGRGYGLDVLGATWEGPAPDKIAWDKYNAISFAINGAPAGELAFDVKDAGGEIYRYMVSANGPDWQEVVIPLADFQPRADWQPQSADGNRVMDFPVKSFQWEPKTAGAGSFAVDCVRLVNTQVGEQEGDE